MIINKELIQARLSGLDTTLKPNQNEISLPIVVRIFKKMKSGLMFPPIHVSTENVIDDGHHRYIGSILADYQLEIRPDYPTPTVMNDYDWKDVKFIDLDYDTGVKINKMNLIDASYNGITIEQVEQIIK